MFAVIKTGGKQYRVAAQDVITIERLALEPGQTVALDALMIGDGEDVHVGAPTVAGASVTVEVVELTRGKKVIAFKKRRRQNSKRKRGHRQDLMTVRIIEIAAAGKSDKGEAKSGEAKSGEAKAGEAKAGEAKAASTVSTAKADEPAAASAE